MTLMFSANLLLRISHITTARMLTWKI